MNSRTELESSPIDERRRLLLRGAACVPLLATAGCGGGSTFSMGSMGMGGPSDTFSPVATEHSVPVLPLETGTLDASGVRQFALRVQRGTTRFREGVETATLGYNGPLLGPAIRLRTGEKTRIRVHNDLDEATTVHWHGLVVAADADGGPHQPIAPGATWEARFTVANPASTCWFHPHGHGVTGRQVLSGLAGLLIVDDPQVDMTPLPRTWGVDDLALVLQDKRFTASGQIDTRLSADEQVNGYRGETLLVNGVAGAVWQAPRQWVRLRLLNGCNARTLSLRLNSATALLQLANEAGWLARSVARTALALAPGERAEVLVDLGSVPAGGELALLARSVDTGMGMGSWSGDAEVPALKMRVGLPRQDGAISAPPSAWPTAPAIVAPAAAPSRNFTLDGGMMGEPFTINGRSFDMRRMDFAVAADAVEVWRFFNATMMAHPVHVHGVRMSLLTRDGTPPAPHERGLRDTFVVEPMQTVAVAVQAPAVASPTPLMFHCHILEHEDAGMMGQFVVV